MVQSLYEIALWKCIQLAARITDVGDIPYPLVQPVLKRLNAKQLLVVEQNSPSIVPECDELWARLIEKDFPDRPAVLKKMVLQNGEDAMPNKSLYNKYSLEREELRASSAQRLRTFTNKLQREKSKNSIVAIQGIMKEPIVRRRIPGPALMPAAVSKYASKSIMGKAMKDVQHRLLMFGGSQKNERRRSERTEVPKPVALARPPGFLVPSEGPAGIYLLRPLGRAPSPVRTDRKINSDVRSPVRSNSSSSAETSPLPEVRRRPNTSVFITTKKMPRAPRILPETRPKRDEKAPILPERTLAVRKPVRSSIFH